MKYYRGKRRLKALTLVLFAAVTLVSMGTLVTPVEGEAKTAALDFPNQRVTVVVPWPPGGRTDASIRSWAPALEEELGVTVVVENRPGGGGVVGARSVARAGADGHTIGVFSMSHIVAQWTKIPSFNLDDFIPVALAYSSPFVLGVNADSPWETLTDFLAYVKANPGEVRNGNAGTGASSHVASEAFYRTAGVRVRQIPYEGDAPAVAALLRHEVDAVIAPMVSMVNQVEAGNVRVLGVSQAMADELHRDIPTFREQGVDFVFGDLGGGIYVPRETPKATVNSLESGFARVFEREDVKQRLRGLFLEADFQPAASFEQIIGRWNPVLEELTRELGLHLN